MPSRSRILIAEDHKLIAELCQRLLETDFNVVGVVSDGRSLVRAAVELKPDVIVVDVAMPVLNGLDAGGQIKKTLPAAKLVYLTMNPDADVAADAFELGASGYLLKTCAAAEIVLAVREALRGKTYVSKDLSPDIIESILWERRERANHHERLTDRQLEVLQLVAEGKMMKEIGSILQMSPRTVASHKYKMMKKLGATSTSELVRYAIRNRLVAA
jgi:DNA-binding NarL/FixJ family response regulator